MADAGYRIQEESLIRTDIAEYLIEFLGDHGYAVTSADSSASWAKIEPRPSRFGQERLISTATTGVSFIRLPRIRSWRTSVPLWMRQWNPPRSRGPGLATGAALCADRA
mgnify:CR=1 FL=1